MDIKPNCYYKTRSGLKARIYAVDGVGGAVIHGAVLQQTNGWNQFTWYRGGTFYIEGTSDFDLVDIWTERKPKLKAWLCSASSINKGVYYTNFSDEAPSNDVRWIRAEWLDQP